MPQVKVALRDQNRSRYEEGGVLFRFNQPLTKLGLQGLLKRFTPYSVPA
jgi:hypothetical protein